MRDASKSLLGSVCSLSMALPAEAHHLAEGHAPETLADELLSSLAHPVIGLDHVASLTVVLLIISLNARRLATLGTYLAAKVTRLIMRMHHDMGGQPAGPIERSEHACAPWEKLIDAVFTLLSTRHGELFRVDELRRSIEALAPNVYDELSYYERWVAAITNTMMQRGVLTSEELGRKMEEVRARLCSHEQT